jgi:hypothetical protein
MRRSVQTPAKATRLESGWMREGQMRLLQVIFLAIVAVGAAGVWALGEFGGAFSSA